MKPTMPTRARQKVPVLKRTLTLPVLALYGLGNIVGAGIYVLVGEVASTAGYLAPLAFLIAASVALLSALSYGRLAAAYPTTASESVYADAAFGRRKLNILIGLLIAFSGIVSVGALANGFAGYFTGLFDVPVWIVVTAFIGVMSLVAARGIGESAGLAVALTLIEVGGLILILVTGAGAADWQALSSNIQAGFSAPNWGGVLAAAVLAFYAFIGFEDMVNVSEEVRDPAKTLPRAILIAFSLATLLYFAVIFVTLGVLQPADLAGSAAPLSLVYESAGGSYPLVVSAIALMATFNGALVLIIMGSRILYGMAKRGWLPVHLSQVHHKTQTPLRATAVVAGLTLLGALLLPLARLAELTSMSLFIVFFLINVSLIQLVRKRVLTGNIILPILGAMASASLLVASLVQKAL